jgi:hypothetical protein
MPEKYRGIPKKIAAGQAGQALLIVLVFFLLGSLTLTPVLMHMGTALKAGIKYESKTNELYTADAGIDTGLWRIKYDYMGPDYDPYDYASTWIYETDPVNHSTADVSVQNLWLPSNVTLAGVGLNAASAKAMVETEKLIVSGASGVNPGQPFHIKMDFDPADGDNLTIKSIGVWLPQGFEYNGPSDLEPGGFPRPEYYPDEVAETTVAGGKTVVWSYNSPYPHFIDFPNYAVEDGIMTITFTFSYFPLASDPDKMPLAMTWVTTAMDPTCINPNDVPLAWDTDIRYYKIASVNGNTEIETYQSKSQLRNLRNGTAGDYIAIGNSVMLDNYSPYDKRDTLLAESSTDVAEVAPIPANGDVLYAYLYWSGFRHSQSLWADTCGNFNNWTLGASDGSLNVLPIADNSSSGTWTTAPLWSKVDETTSAGDSDYIIGTTDGGGYQLFTFGTPAIQEQPIASITVHIRARDDGSTKGNNDIRPAIKLNGVATPYYPASVNNPDLSFLDYSYTWTTNPHTGLAWTYQEVTNPSTAYGLQLFGVYSSDLAPDMRVSIVYLTVTYSAYWSINSGQFQGRGENNSAVDPRYLTMTNSYNLSSYAPGTIAVSWTQSDYESSGSLESGDTLYYAFSADNGATWSNGAAWDADDEVFHDDITTGSKFILVPEDYFTSGFKMRFYYNFNDPTEYVRLDNINIYYMPPDTSVTFKIDGEQVCFNGDGEPVAESGNLTAGFSAVLMNLTGTTAAGYSYACYKDVTDLVKKYPETPGETHHTGNYEFTVGSISADTGEYISYAGWSLIIIYSSPDTAGRYIYLRDIHDIFAFNGGYENLDFDNDGVPGGDVTGFLFPDPVRDKYGAVVDPTAAKITCFVGEGDVNYLDDTLIITGQQSGLSEYLSNDESPQDNIWNSASPGMSYPGIDVDTFNVLWTDGILTPKDTSLHLDMNSGQDAWNLVYFIMSVRSETVTAGTGHYMIDNN